MEAKKEIPILMSTPMVQAILDGRKTMTRRVVNPQPPAPQGTFPANWNFRYWAGSPFKSGSVTDPERFELVDGIGRCFGPLKNYGKPGDVLWVRETMIKNDGFTYWPVASGYKKNTPLDKVIPSTHMPKSACRIWLEVISVKVERLQEITEEDARGEGYSYSDWHSMNEEAAGATLHSIPDKPISWFNELWLKINGPDSWEANPWVWVIEFKRIDNQITNL